MTAVAVGSGARNRRLNAYRTAKLLGGGADIERVQVLENRAVEFDLGDDVQRTGGGVDHGRAGDAHFGGDIAAKIQIRIGADRAAAGRDQALLPVQRARVGINRIHAVMLGGDVNDVMGAAADGHVGQIQRLGENRAVHRGGEEFAELAAVHVRRGEVGLLRVLPGSRIVVVVGRHVHLGVQRSRPQRQHRRDGYESVNTKSHGLSSLQSKTVAAKRLPQTIGSEYREPYSESPSTRHNRERDSRTNADITR
jgi:hypothetical protein